MCCIVCFYYGSVNQWFLVPDDRDTRFEVYFYYHSSSLPFSFDDVFVYFQLRELSGEKINFYFFFKILSFLDLIDDRNGSRVSV